MLAARLGLLLLVVVLQFVTDVIERDFRFNSSFKSDLSGDTLINDDKLLLVDGSNGDMDTAGVLEVRLRGVVVVIVVPVVTVVDAAITVVEILLYTDVGGS